MYPVLLKGTEAHMNVSYHKCLKRVLAFLDIWLEKFPSFTTFESVVYTNPVMLEALQLLFHPLSRDEPIFHSIMKSKDFLKHKSVLNAFIVPSTPDMFRETVPDSVFHALIQAGSHLYSVASSNQTPIECCICKLSPQYLALLSYYPLKLACLSARVVVQYQLSTDKLPGFYGTFIDLHRTASSKGDEYISLSLSSS
ncbi:hypothetical protein LOD99_10739 [Oopsacas minuta]|uniref:N-terminal Ras-GEF domain-containing protein n=1 Tax=Oopsacas minuta TaxID=111878 RepID=A0AAV7KEI5_9METZ|nr:hypothetical protein LOD99_10739 [Oopsacas minuta]